MCKSFFSKMFLEFSYKFYQDFFFKSQKIYPEIIPQKLSKQFFRDFVKWLLKRFPSNSDRCLKNAFCLNKLLQKSAMFSLTILVVFTGFQLLFRYFFFAEIFQNSVDEFSHNIRPGISSKTSAWPFYYYFYKFLDKLSFIATENPM